MTLGRFGDLLQELRELGLRGSAFRTLRELRFRTGVARRFAAQPRVAAILDGVPFTLGERTPFADPRSVREAVGRMQAPEALDALTRIAEGASSGDVLCFGRRVSNFGDPIDWYRDPVTHARWDADVHWTQALSSGPADTDVKLVWEPARFPQAYHLARAAALRPESAPTFAAVLCSQVRSFLRSTPCGRGVHWASNQEIAFRLLAWVFAFGVFRRLGCDLGELDGVVASAFAQWGEYIESDLEYARYAVYNNHLLSEAMGLYALSLLLPRSAPAERWRKIGLEILDSQADRQFYPDGGYIQLSHNYHRVALQDYLAASSLRAMDGEAVPSAWLRALERSLEFLLAHQNPTDGRLPNYGNNDGALPCPLSTCDFADFRPTLQAVSLLVRGERCYEPGPWDEEAAWWFGSARLDAAVQSAQRPSASFPLTGFHVQRGDDASTFSAFRCGAIRDRFSQIDMLTLDVWWRGANVLVDPGTFLYNGAAIWHEHFTRTGSHNTVQVDGLDQMVHHRRFKSLYWTRGELLRFEVHRGASIAAGRHHGFERLSGVRHDRTVVFHHGGMWIIVDRLEGRGRHSLRLQWLGGFAARAHGQVDCMRLAAPAGDFVVRVVDPTGRTLSGDVVAGQEDPPRGWVSRYYAEKIAAPSFVVEQRTELPATFITVLSPGDASLTTISPGRLEASAGALRLRVALLDDLVVRVE